MGCHVAVMADRMTLIFFIFRQSRFRRHLQVIAQMNQTRKIAGRDAAELVIALQKSRRIERGHAERILEGNAEPLHAVAHRLVHGEVGTGKCSVLELQTSIPARDRAALQFEMIGTAGRCRHGIGNQHHAVVGASLPAPP